MTRTTAQRKAADAAHYLHPFTDFKSLSGEGTRVIERARRTSTCGTARATRMLDAISGLWCVNVGYGRGN